MTLLSTILSLGLTEPEALNALTAARIISDNAVSAADVAEPDATKAVEWLRGRFGE